MQVRVGLVKAQVSLRRLRRGQIVVGKEQNDGRPAQLETAIIRLGTAAPVDGLEMHAQARILPRPRPFKGFRMTVAPGGVDDHHLVIGRRQGLVDQGAEKAVEIRRVIVGGDEEADPGHLDRGNKHCFVTQ
jgi:hypothetical protein